MGWIPCCHHRHRRHARDRRGLRPGDALVADADSGQVLLQSEATAQYLVSLTKLMTVYVALDAVPRGMMLDTPLVMSARAARMPPSKMGFRPGTEVTLDNALKMLMVKSPNDVAVMVARAFRDRWRTSPTK